MGRRGTRQHEQTLDTVKSPGERLSPIQRLAYLDTPAAISKVVSLFLKTSNDSEGWLIYSGLRESSHAELIIPALLAALSDTTVNVPPLLPQAARGTANAKRSGPVQLRQRILSKGRLHQKLKERYKVRDSYFGRDNAQLLSSIQLRTGPQRANAIYQAFPDRRRTN